MTAEYKVHGDVAVVTMNNPPVNGLGYATRTAITDGLNKANADPAVKAIVITGADETSNVSVFTVGRSPCLDSGAAGNT